jgi:hypothetical protein
VLLISPQGAEVATQCLDYDISSIIDPDTGLLVSSGQTTIAVNMSPIREAGLEIPRRTEENTTEQWRIRFGRLDEETLTVFIRISDPDYTRDELRLTVRL